MCEQQWERNSACDGQIAGWQTTQWGKENKEMTSFKKAQKANILSFQGLTASFDIQQGVFSTM